VKRVWLITSRNRQRKSKAGGQSSTVESVTTLIKTRFDCFQNPANRQQSTLEEATDEFSMDGQEGKV